MKIGTIKGTCPECKRVVDISIEIDLDSICTKFLPLKEEDMLIDDLWLNMYLVSNCPKHGENKYTASEHGPWFFVLTG